MWPTGTSSKAFKRTSQWQTAYHRYRALEAEFFEAGRPQRLALVLLHATARGLTAFESECRRAAVLYGPGKGKTLKLPSSGLLSELRALAGLRSSHDRKPDFVYDDVYHLAYHYLAIWRKYGEIVEDANECSQLYRGQRNDTWQVGAKIYRPPEGTQNDKDAIRDRAVQACRAAHAISERWPKFDFDDALAIAQHYSKELNVSTWLADFTRDPWVSLFFATDHGKSEECGLVWWIMPSEFSRLIPSVPLQLIVPEVERVRNQKGVFISAAIPTMFEQYVAPGRETKFRQHEGVVFEDKRMGVTEDLIYPQTDQFLPEIPNVISIMRACQCTAVSNTHWPMYKHCSKPGAYDDIISQQLDKWTNERKLDSVRATEADSAPPRRQRETAIEPRDSARALGECAIPSSVYDDPSQRETYERILTHWLNEMITERHPSSDIVKNIRSAISPLAGFHAMLHSSAYVGRLKSYLGRSATTLREAFVTIYLAAESGDHFSVREIIRKRYVLDSTLQVGGGSNWHFHGGAGTYKPIAGRHCLRTKVIGRMNRLLCRSGRISAER